MDLSELTDEEIVQKIQQLDENDNTSAEINYYYEELFNRYNNQIYSICRYHGLKHNDSLDIIQETFLKMFMSFSSFKKNFPFKPWFFKIVLNSIKNKYNELKRHRFIQIENLEKISSEEEKKFDLLQNREYITGIINILPDTLREVVLLKVYGELDMKEIAKIVGISLRQAYNRFNEGCKILKEKLGEKYGRK
ncbi:MAG: RNA polymerase sigma factor [Brevinematia bacterium]